MAGPSSCSLKRRIVTKTANGGKVLARRNGSETAASARDLKLHDDGDGATVAKSFVRVHICDVWLRGGCIRAREGHLSCTWKGLCLRCRARPLADLIRDLSAVE